VAGAAGVFGAGAALLAVIASVTDSGMVAYPYVYRNWVHVKTQLIGRGSPFFDSGGGMHHIYANETAMKGYASGRFEDGAVLVFDLREVRVKDDVTSEDSRQRIDVMVKDRERFAATGGWGFERFVGADDTRRNLTEEHRAQCFRCHETRRDHDFVFSEFHE
jgi:hypothetical protein